MPPSLDIVIVNWNSGSHLRRSVTAIKGAICEEFNLARVVVVDNASSDDSADGLSCEGLPLSVMRNSENLGFAAACNQGAKGSTADYLLFLNPDVALLEDSLSLALRFMEDPLNDRVGICGIQLLDESGRVSPTCSRFPEVRQFYSKILGLDRMFPQRFPPTLLTDWPHDQTKEVDQVMGAFMLVRRPVFQLLSGFDERFFVYFEDVDFSYRAYQAGWKSKYLIKAKAYHSGHGCTAQASAVSLFYILQSRILYGYKHFSWSAATGLLLATVLLEPLPRLISAVATNECFANAPETLRAYARLWRAMPSIFQQSLQTFRGSKGQRI